MPFVRYTSVRGLIVVFLYLVSAGPLAATDKDDKDDKLTRSIYLPVEFELCEHLHDAVLYQGEQALSALPAKRIFQFTFYPHLDRIEPTRTDVRVEGVRSNGKLFTGKLAVTPWGLFTANRKIELDLDKQLTRMKYRLDVRYKARKLKMRCSDTCGLAPAAVAAQARIPSP